VTRAATEDSYFDYRHLFEASAEGIILATPDGVILDANLEACCILQRTREEIIAAGFDAFVDWTDHRLEPALLKQRETGKFRGELSLLDRDGVSLPVEASMSSWRGTGGEERIGIFFRDLSERKQAEEALRESEEQFRATFDHAAVGIAHVGTDGQWLRINQRLCDIVGYTREELLQRTFQDITHPEDLEAGLKQARRLITGEIRTHSTEKRYIRKDGSVVWANLAVSLVREPSGEPKYFISIIEDISQRKEAEKRLQNSLNALLALHEASRILSSTLKLEEIGPRLLEIMHRASDLSAAVINLLGEQGQLCVLHAVGPGSLWRAASTTPEAQAARCKALKTKERQQFRLRKLECSGMPAVGLGLPLVVGDRLIGVLEVYGPEALATKETIGLLQSLTNQAASVLENARLYMELAKRERRLQDLVGKLLVAQEEERRRVAHEVHDGLTQVATATHQNLQAFARNYLPGSTLGQTKLGCVLELAQQTVREARRVIADLRPAVLDDFGLAVALRLRVERLENDGWEISYDETLGNERLPIEIETVLYRVTQEALTNVDKHSQTTKVHITLARRRKSVYLEVRDQGCGFDQSPLLERSDSGERVGLCSMRERIALLDGDFRINSQPGSGTSIVAEVPLPESEGVNAKNAE
jgi:PAS domain S-box-containing protein